MVYVVSYSLLWNVGNFVLSEPLAPLRSVAKLLTKVPLSFVFVYVKVLAEGVAVTVNVPLYPLSPIPVVFVELYTFLTTTWSLTLNLCGSSEVTVVVLPALEIPEIILGLRFVITVALLSTIWSTTVLDSCNV